MANRKKAVELSSTPEETLNRLSNVDTDTAVNARGVAGDPIREPVPEYIKTSSDVIYKNGNNAWIVLGRDRPASLLSGYGGRGDTQAASIDLVAGRLGYEARETGVIRSRRTWVNPSFKKDAARIYISQKTDVDENFKLASGFVGNTKTKSAVAMKADGIRLVAREGIKLVTKTDEKNSQGGDIIATSGIDLIAGNDDSDLQPMVKGDNLVAAMDRIVFHMDKLNGIVDSLLMAQMTFNTQLGSHFHISPFFGAPTSPSPVLIAGSVKTMMEHLFQTKRSLITHKTNLAFFRQTYLRPYGERYINSRFNNTN